MDIDSARAMLRRRAVRAILYAVWPRPMGVGLINASLPPDLAGSPEVLDEALAYLQDRGTVAAVGVASGGGPAMYALTPDGVDHVESDEDRDLNAVRAVRMLRLRVLQALSWGGPAPMGLSLIGTALASDTDLDLSEPSIRRALAYLTDGTRRLATEAGGLYRITANGVDYLEGTGDACDGVARPQVW